jgi:putative effector of murein hydrolase
MFSTGQWIFAVLFLISFVAIAIYVYKKDAQIHQHHYKGSSKVVWGFFIFIFLLFIMKIFLKR